VALGSSGIIVAAVFREHPSLLVVAGFTGAAAGWLIGLTRWRVWFATAGLAACGITALISGPVTLPPTVFGPDPAGGPAIDPFGTALMIIGVAATVSAIASVTPVLTDHSWIPATFGALAVTLQSGIGYLEAHIVNGAARERGVEAVVSGDAALLLLTAAVVAATAFWPRAAPPPVGEDDPTVELEREAVWFRLPDDD
jgi:hypothetical protein